MELNNELEILKSLFLNNNVNAFKKQVNLLKKSFTSEAEVKRMNEFIDVIVKEKMKRMDRDYDEIKSRAESVLIKNAYL